MQPVSRNIIAAAVNRSTEGAASTLAAGAEGASTAMEKTIKYRNGDTYIGQVDNDGQKDGQGIVKMANGDIYKGQFKDGMLHGEGKYSWADGREYDGEFSNNFIHGKGEMKYNDGTVYDGEFMNNNKHGKGILKFNDGTVSDVMCNNGELLLMHTLALRLKRSIEVIWHHLNLPFVLGMLMGLWALYCQM